MRFKHLFLLLATGACAIDGVDDDPIGDVQVAVHTTATAIPPDGECIHLTATRLSDFAVSEYRGLLDDAVFGARKGEHRIVAVAYPQPCNMEPASPPWRADEQIVGFVSGENTLRLSFRANVSVGIEPEFDNEATLVVRDGTRVRTGRNGEDAAGPDFVIDGWEVKRIAVPPPGGGGTMSETTLFSTQGQGGLPYTPRGLASRPGGGFVVQVAEILEPLRVFDASGAYVESWPVVPGAIEWSNTDGLDTIDATHFVRTGWLNAPIDCDASGAGCVQSGIEILELRSGPTGNYLEVTQQITLPELPGMPLNAEYPVGVSWIGGNYVVTTLPGVGSRLVTLDVNGAVVGTPATIAGSAEGPFDPGDGRIGIADYTGRVAMYDAGGTARPGEEAAYTVGVDFSVPIGLAWSDVAGSFVALADHRLVLANPTFTSITDLPIDLSAMFAPSGIDVRPDTNELAVIDRIPPIDPATNTRIPVVVFHDLATGAQTGAATLQGLPLPVRPRTIAWMRGRNQIVSHHRRPGGVADAAVDAVAWIHDVDGTQAARIDLGPLGFTRILHVNHLPATDELLFTVIDATGTVRLLVTDPAGSPRRSYRTDAIAGLTDGAQITNGVFTGDVGVVIGQPSEYVRISLP